MNQRNLGFLLLKQSNESHAYPSRPFIAMSYFLSFEPLIVPVSMLSCSRGILITTPISPLQWRRQAGSRHSAWAKCSPICLYLVLHQHPISNQAALCLVTHLLPIQSLSGLDFKQMLYHGAWVSSLASQISLPLLPYWNQGQRKKQKSKPNPLYMYISLSR